MDVKQYLKKIGCEDAGEKVNLENLTRIRDGHNRTFTFENLDIHMKIPIKLSLEDAYNRLMNNSRGGYCLQLNFVLAWALKELGYDTKLLSIYIYSRGFDVYDNWPVHVGIVVNLDGKQYYVDAGTTRFISQPIEIVLDKDQKGKFGVYKFIKDEENPGYLRLKRSRNVQNNEKLEYEDQLRIKLDEPKQMEDFIEMNEYVQTEKHPMLFYRTLCVRQSENMVYFLAGWKYSEITFNEFGETRVDKIVETIEEIRNILRNKFDLIVDDSFQPVDIQK